MPDYSVFFQEYQPFDLEDAMRQLDLEEQIREEERDVQGDD